MKIKRFFARDMRQALLQVKDELGAEAVIMSNKKVAGGVEIVAAVDGDSSPSEPRQMQSNALAAPTRPQSGYDGSRQTNDRQADGRNHNSGRSLKDDVVNLNQKSSASAPSVTDRFANMLKNYRGADSNASKSASTPPDSLSALLERQSERAKSVSDGYQNSDRYQYAQENRSDFDSRDNRSSVRSTGRHQFAENSTDAPRRGSSPRDAKIGEELEAMKEDMSSIRRLLEHQVSGLMWQEVERREPLRAMLIKRLERMGLSPELSDQLACYIPEDTPPQKAWKALLSLVSDQIVVSKQDILRKGGIVALLGPTGVGKTTTVAKLAARAAMEYGSDNVALVTTDTYRIGAHEQLSIYGRIMGCPVRVAKDSEELADVLYQLRNRRLVLIDTAGMGQRDVRLSEQLDTLMQESGEVIHSYLVLPATAQRQVLQETLDHFRRIPLSGCIMTKLDESLSLGEFISVVVQNALPVTYIANGQRVPEDIVIAQPKYMVAKANELLEKSTENEPHFWNSDMEGV
ncbi:flagellar biosynthesis protein FlhF [Vibrio mediterranei]|uniref:flagellar biosynthesis protein FlhF n=1 Tax=Vibrio mediterranei TaxID=689 RepID=UPI0022833316|nr:flagellar biosynthesis protein FlhF [Vibrio mediterranei]MCY9851075.1 flagellar biosynthesis protein FlhF [Vibrio mediterranei]